MLVIFFTLDKLNQRTIEEIQKSLFLLCLDNECDMSDVDPRTRAALQLIHGGGSRCNGGNRWFDKTVQVVFYFTPTSVALTTAINEERGFHNNGFCWC